MMLEEFSKIRRQKASVKYLMPTGENQAFYRDSLLDILEELADALHIAELTRNKVRKHNRELLEDFMVQYDKLLESLTATTETVIEMRRLLPEIYSTDQIVVDRPCLMNKEGTEVIRNFFLELGEGDTDES